MKNINEKYKLFCYVMLCYSMIYAAFCSCYM